MHAHTLPFPWHLTLGLLQAHAAKVPGRGKDTAGTALGAIFPIIPFLHFSPSSSSELTAPDPGLGFDSHRTGLAVELTEGALERF